MTGLNKTHAEQSLAHLNGVINELMDAARKGDELSQTSAYVRAHNELRILADAIGCHVPVPSKQREALMPDTAEITDAELARCPFCGRRPHPIIQNSSHPLRGFPGRWMQQVWCENCGITGPERATDTEAIAAWNRRAEAQASVPSEVVAVPGRYHHKKRGEDVTLIAMGKMQAENWVAEGEWQGETLGFDTSSVDMQPVAIYRADDGSWWVRPEAEFEDGRFEPLATPSPEPAAVEVVVKRLVWEYGPFAQLHADSAVGRYHIWNEAYGDTAASAYFQAPEAAQGKQAGETLEQAKAAAQADFDQRILSALATPPSPEPSEAEVEAAVFAANEAYMAAPEDVAFQVAIRAALTAARKARA